MKFLAVVLSLFLLSGTSHAENYFQPREFACHHCGKIKIDPELLARLNILRDRLNAPVYVTSGYRCQRHNRDVGGVPNSQHTLGKASDVMSPGHTPEEVAKVAVDVGFRFVKVYENFVHVDVREKSEKVDEKTPSKAKGDRCRVGI